MIEFLNTVTHTFLLPPTSMFLIILIGLLMWRRWPRAGRIVAGAGLALLTLLSSIAGSQLLVGPLENLTRPLWMPERAGGQAIVVLAAGRITRAPEYNNLDVPDYVGLGRLRYAAHLQRRTHLPLLVTGGLGLRRVAGLPNGRAYSMADSMAAALVQDFGVPVRWIEPNSRNTRQNAEFSAAMLRAAGVHRILLVTDAMHMPRARAMFDETGLEVIAAPTFFFSESSLLPIDFLPSAEGMRRTWYATYEWIGIAWHKLHGDRIAATQPRVVGAPGKV